MKTLKNLTRKDDTYIADEFNMPKIKYKPSDEIDYQMLDPLEIIGKKIVDVYLHQDPLEGDELQIILEDGNQVVKYMCNLIKL
jgi:hypothetical protein